MVARFLFHSRTTAIRTSTTAEIESPWHSSPRLSPLSLMLPRHRRMAIPILWELIQPARASLGQRLDQIRPFLPSQRRLSKKKRQNTDLAYTLIQLTRILWMYPPTAPEKRLLQLARGHCERSEQRPPKHARRDHSKAASQPLHMFRYQLCLNTRKLRIRVGRARILVVLRPRVRDCQHSIPSKLSVLRTDSWPAYE